MGNILCVEHRNRLLGVPRGLRTYPMSEITPVSRDNFSPYFMSTVIEDTLKDSHSLPKAYPGGT